VLRVKRKKNSAGCRLNFFPFFLKKKKKKEKVQPYGLYVKTKNGESNNKTVGLR
jgi:hypothetical protein